ncbi:hypothetical protein PVK06_047227 [Gossypium arboreum]|uniref:Uncharacterized protein n=1 Tax=Gossypium arboreum TaxID=29729 RepID=A0ABR0MD48_GOSAR|nr:hypothetical protein PVK06_047227 [Gossypium arboreum]
MVEQHGWQIFCLRLEDVLTNAVHEFYAHLTSLNAFIYVRGASMLFDKDAINAHKKINVGKIIFKEVHQYAQKNAGSLNFPSLIIALCQHVNAFVQANKDVTPNKGVTIKKIVVNISGEDFPWHQPPGSATTSSNPIYATTSPSTTNNIFE